MKLGFWHTLAEWNNNEVHICKEPFSTLALVAHNEAERQVRRLPSESLENLKYTCTSEGDTCKFELPKKAR